MSGNFATEVGEGLGWTVALSGYSKIPTLPALKREAIGKGQMGSAPMGSLQSSCFLLTGTFRVLPLTCFYLPKSARAYPFPQSIKIHYFRSGPIN